MKNLGLLLVAVMLAILFFPLGFFFTLIEAVNRGSVSKALGYLSNSAVTTALSIDLMGNVVVRDLMNRTLIHSEARYEFGNYRETISSVLGKNKALGTLTDAGRALANFLNWIDPGHVERAAAVQ